MKRILRQYIFVFLVLMTALLFEDCSSPHAAVSGLSKHTRTHSQQVPQSVIIPAESARKRIDPVEIHYLFYLPKSYGSNPQKKWPLILFLHGSGERGSDLDLLTRHPLPQMLDTAEDFPAIVVSPQLPSEKNGWDDLIDPLVVLMDQIQSTYAVDPARIYLTGLSMGGRGTWNFAVRYPQYFSAIVPIAGAYKKASREIPANICELKNLPIWTFHGTRDEAVAVWQTQILVDTLRACGSSIRCTIYPDAGHEESWRKAYADPELFTWLFSQTRK